MIRFNRRYLLGYSFWGTSAALVGGRATAAGDVTTGAATGNPYANDGVVRWVVDDTSAVADTDSGKVVGYIRNDIRIFQGIPYGEILSPEGRWARGAKARSWAGKRSSRAQGPVCPPDTDSPFGGVDGNVLDSPYADEELLRDSDVKPLRPGEDCLRINVCTPGIDDKKRQVLFWCHGGGFRNGSPLMCSRYEPYNLAKYGDVVVVSMTHRLNALGFLDLTAYGSRYADSANLGMLDIVDALKWVRTNIANFGGDPDKVMIAGQSGGGAKVLALLAMPEANGLFNRAVAESPGGLPFSTPEQSAALAAAFLKQLDLSPNNVDALHKLPAKTLTAAAAALSAAAAEARRRADLANTISGWQPVVDSRAVRYDPTRPTVPSDVPLLIGSNLHEDFMVLGHPDEYAQMNEPQARELVRVFFGPIGDDVYDIYRGAFPKATPYELSAMARATGNNRALCVKTAQRRAAFDAAPTYNYWFQWRADTFEGRAMSHHELEIPLVFLNSDEVPNLTGGTAEARALSLKMADAWLAFARAGDPNTKALPNWSPVTANAVTSMVFDNTCRIDHGSDLAAIEMFWKNRYPNG